MQVEKLKGKVDILQAETDTCPQNRYSTGAMMNIGFDPIEEVELMCKEPVSEVQMLMPDGSRKALEFQCENGKCTIGVSCVTLQPLVLFIR